MLIIYAKKIIIDNEKKIIEIVNIEQYRWKMSYFYRKVKK